MIFERTCPVCGKKFTTRNARKVVCCKECRRVRHNMLGLVRRTTGVSVRTVKCPVCGKEFKTTHHSKSCCSAECRYEFSRRKAHDWYHSRFERLTADELAEFNTRNNERRKKWSQSQQGKECIKRYREKNRDRINKRRREKRAEETPEQRKARLAKERVEQTKIRRANGIKPAVRLTPEEKKRKEKIYSKNRHIRDAEKRRKGIADIAAGVVSDEALFVIEERFCRFNWVKNNKRRSDAIKRKYLLLARDEYWNGEDTKRARAYARLLNRSCSKRADRRRNQANEKLDAAWRSIGVFD